MKYNLGDYVRWRTDARNCEEGSSTILFIDEHDPHPYAILSDGEWLNLSEDEILEVLS